MRSVLNVKLQSTASYFYLLEVEVGGTENEEEKREDEFVLVALPCL